MRDDIKYQIILFPILGEVFLGVINDMVCAKRAHEVQLAGVIHPSHLGPIQFGKLNCNRTGTTTGAINQNLLSWLDLSFIANPLEGNNGRLRDGRCFFECHPGWFQCQPVFRRTDIFGKTTQTRQDVSEDFIPWLISTDVSASHFNSPGYVRSEYLVTWSQKPPYAGIQRFTSESLPVRSIYGYRLNLDQYFIVLRSRFCYLFELKDLWYSVFCVHNRLHKYSLILVCATCATLIRYSICRKCVLRTPFPTLLRGAVAPNLTAPQGAAHPPMGYL